eukprot:3308655-Pleurochrysis_carterae.AAC.1
MWYSLTKSNADCAAVNRYSQWSVHNARVWRNNHDACNTWPRRAKERQASSMSVAASEKMVASGAGPTLVRGAPCTKVSSSRVRWTLSAGHSKIRRRRWCKGVSWQAEARCVASRANTRRV